MSSTRIIYYASIMGTLPRKRKEQRFECSLIGSSTVEAKEKLAALIKNHNIKNVRNAQIAPYSCSEITFVDSYGVPQVIVSRSMLPTGQAILLEDL